MFRRLLLHNRSGPGCTAASTLLRPASVRRNHTAYEAPFLKPRKANYEPLSPISFLKRTAKLYPKHKALVYRDVERNWAEQNQRIKKLASSLYKAGVRPGDTVSVMALNIPPIFEAHFAVPGIRAVINTLNTRLDAKVLAFQLKHGESKVLLTDTEHSGVMEAALKILEEQGLPRPLVIDIVDPNYLGAGKQLGKFEYEDFLSRGDESFELTGPEDENDAIALNYTSGTTGDPKGVVSNHRGAYLNSLGNIVSWNIPHHSVFLHVVPMFHCNGWCFPWAITAVGGTHVCTRWVRADLLYEAIEQHRVTHFGGAPIVMNLLLNAADEHKRDLRGHDCVMMTAGAPPPPPLIKALKKETGIRALSAYGLTETYGPSTIYIPMDPEDFPNATEAELDAQLQWQACNVVTEDLIVADPETLSPVPADGKTIGEVFFRGNVVMNGYLKNEKATEDTFRGGWLNTGDLAVQQANGRIQIRDRSKDVIISGGENISSIEVENILHTHPSVSEAAVVAKPDEKWGEVPCAFVSLKDGHVLSEDELIAFARQNLAHYKAPKRILFGPLPKTATGKIQKFVLRNLAKEHDDQEAKHKKKA